MQKCACRSGFVCIRSLSSRSLNGREFPLRYLKMSMKEFDSYYYDHINSEVKYIINYTVLEAEKDIVTAFDSGESVRVYISPY